MVNKKWLYIPVVLSIIILPSVYFYTEEIFKECTAWECSVSTTLDENGIYMVDYSNYANAHIGKVYNPNFVNKLSWFEENVEIYDEYYLIPYDYNWVIFNKDKSITYTEAPFYSCEGQGKAIQLSMQKYNETGDTKYRDMAYKYYYGITNTELNDNYWVYGFYHKSIGGIDILNSQMYCLINIYDFYKETNDPK